MGGIARPVFEHVGVDRDARLALRALQVFPELSATDGNFLHTEIAAHGLLEHRAVRADADRTLVASDQPDVDLAVQKIPIEQLSRAAEDWHQTAAF